MHLTSSISKIVLAILSSVFLYSSSLQNGLLEHNGEVKTSKDSKEGEAQTRAVIIGISDYRQAKQLSYADDDAKRFATTLKADQANIFTNVQIDLLLDDQATYSNIMNALEGAINKADENDTVIFFFAGHGQKGLFLPFDSDGITNVLLHQEILTVLNDSKAMHNLIFADACHSGSFLQVRDSYAKNSCHPINDRISILMSSSNNEISIENSVLKAGVYSHHLTEGLKGKADMNGDSVVLISELFEYATMQVVGYTDRRQNPIWLAPRQRA